MLHTEIEFKSWRKYCTERLATESAKQLKGNILLYQNCQYMLVPTFQIKMFAIFVCILCTMIHTMCHAVTSPEYLCYGFHFTTADIPFHSCQNDHLPPDAVHRWSSLLLPALPVDQWHTHSSSIPAGYLLGGEKYQLHLFIQKHFIAPHG